MVRRSDEFGLRLWGLIVLSIAVAACGPEAAAPAASVAAAPSGKLGRTCADHPVNCSYKAQEHRPAAGKLATVAGGRELVRTQGPPPKADELPALVQIRIGRLWPADQRWHLNLGIASAAHRTIDPSVACDFTNADLPVARTTYTAASLLPGQIVAVELSGPLVTDSYVDGAICKVLGPLK